MWLPRGAAWLVRVGDVTVGHSAHGGLPTLLDGWAVGCEAACAPAG